MFSVKALVESECLTTVPPKFLHRTHDCNDVLLSSSEATFLLPLIDFSLLTSDNPHQRLPAIQDLASACREWGFFMLINHGVPESLSEGMIGGSSRFFDLTEEEKNEYEGKKLFDPIRYGSSFNMDVDQVFYWRDYLKIHVHPQFNAPTKPSGFSEIIEEYSRRTREIASELMKGIAEGLGLEEKYIKERLMEMEKGSQLMVINLYPPCPQPEVVVGMPPHSDHGFFTFLLQNHLQGLQIFNNGRWIPPATPPIPNSLFVNLGDHTEILTNGRYKSVLHRAVVNSKATRISIGTAHGPPLDAVVSPAEQLVDKDSQPLAYRGITYGRYLELQQSSQLNAKSCLDHVRIL